MRGSKPCIKIWLPKCMLIIHESVPVPISGQNSTKRSELCLAEFYLLPMRKHYSVNCKNGCIHILYANEILGSSAGT